MRTAVLFLGVLMLAGCSTSELDGVWELETFTIEGQEHSVEIGTHASKQPWVQFDSTMHGSGGCNQFESSDYRVIGNKLIPGDVFSTLAFCLPGTDPEGVGDGSLMQTEFAIERALRASPSIAVSDESMTWRAGGETLVFLRTASPPDQ